MSLGLAYWVIFIIGVVVYGLGQWGGPPFQRWGVAGGGIIGFLLFLIVGWAVFGAPIR